jgi:hypothetical protein
VHIVCTMNPATTVGRHPLSTRYAWNEPLPCTCTCILLWLNLHDVLYGALVCERQSPMRLTS